MTNIKFDAGRLKVVSIDEVRPNSWNPKDKNTPEYVRLVHSIKTKGLRLPMYVREDKKGESLYEIVDGEQRWTACKELGYKEIVIYSFGEIPIKEATEMTLWFQHHIPFEDSKLKSYLAELGKKYTDLNIPYTKEKLEEMQQVVDFNWGKNKDGKKEENKPKTKVVATDRMIPLVMRVSEEQYKVILQTVDRVKEQHEEDLDVKQAVLFICEQYL